MMNPGQPALNSAQGNRIVKQISISKPKKIKNILNRDQSKPNWNERFFLEKIPVYQFQKDRPGMIQKTPKYPVEMGQPGGINGIGIGQGPNLIHVPSNPNIGLEPGKIRKIQLNHQISSTPNGIKMRPISHYKQKREQDENKYSNNPLVQHYINMQEKPIVYDLDQNPKIVEGYLEKLQHDINIEWQEKNIPHFHRKAFSESVKGLPKIDIVQNVYKELKLLKKDRAQIQTCSKMIKARETCLETVKQQIELLKLPIDEEYQKNLLEISVTLKDLRLLSLEVVEQILRWRESIMNYHYIKQQQLLNQNNQDGVKNSPKSQMKYFQSLNLQLPFYYNQRNYMLKMRDDIKFLKQSQLQYHVNLPISTISDPFLLTMQKQQSITDPLFIDYPQITHDCSLLIQRIRASELIIFEESIQRRVKEQFGDYVVKPLNIQESQIQSFLSSYLDQVPVEIKNSFYNDVGHILQFYSTEQEVNFLKIESEGVTDSFQGLAIICVDRQQYQLRRTNILHVSCIEKSFYNSIINTLVDFIWKNDTSEEIRVNLFYQEEQDGKLALDPYVKNIFNNIGFKWKQLVNDPKTSKRSTIFGLRRPTTIPVPTKIQSNNNNHANSIQQQQQQQQSQEQQLEPIQFYNLLIVTEKECTKYPQIQQQFYDIPIHISKALRQIKNNDTLQSVLSSNNNQDTIVKAFGSEDFQIKGTLLEQFEQNQNLNEFCSQVYPNSKFSLSEQGQIVACISKNCYRWKHFKYAKYLNQNYIRIQKNEDIQNIVKKCYSSSDKNIPPLYFIPTDDDQVNFFLLKINEDEMVQIGNGQQDIASFVGNVIQKCDQNEIVDQDLWIPTLQYQQDLHSLPKYQKNTIKNVISKLDFSIDYRPQIDAGLIATQPNEQDSIVWKPPFIIGLVHNELSEKVDYPMISCLIQNNNINDDEQENNNNNNI